MRIELALVLDLHILELLAVVCKSLGMLHDQLVAVVDFFDEEVALLLVGFFQLTQFTHHIISVRLQVLEDLGLDLVPLVNLFHPVLDALVLVVHLVFKNLPFSLKVGQLEVDLLEDVQFTVSLEDGLLEILHFGIGFLLLLSKLVYVVGIIHKLIDDWVNQLLHEMSCLRLNIEPEKLE